MEVYVIYKNPIDYPNQIAVRKFEINIESTPMLDAVRGVILCDSIDEARATIPQGLRCVTRSPIDHASVVETWI